MNRSSYFIKDRAMFGSFPKQEDVNELENNGVKFFVDLTNKEEKKITPYTTTKNYISFPIPDRKVPQNWKDFAKFIIILSDIIKKLQNKELVYLHCKGGHGRSGVVVACLLCYIFNMTPEQSLEHTTKSHSRRTVMRDKWRKIGSPQTLQQKNFVYKFFSPLYLYKAYMSGYTAGFSNFTSHSVVIDDCKFPTAEAAIQSLKNPNDTKYVEEQMNATNPIISRNLATKVTVRKDWEEVRVHFMKEILKAKFDQHKNIKEKLLFTGLRPIIQSSSSNSFWGIGNNGNGENIFGKLLEEVREEYYRS
jgi:ribA/ribD-fused uncharacterized protein